MSGSPLVRGTTLAVVSAVAFGATVPLVHHFGRRVGVFSTASLLYAGAAGLAFLWPERGGEEARVRARHIPRLLLVALLGAVIAPVLLAVGLKHEGAARASLVLNFEAIFTVLLARIFFAETFGPRIVFAAALSVVGGALLVSADVTSAGSYGLLFVLLATVAWALDNTLTRTLSLLSPMGVVGWKAGLGALLTFVLAIAFRETRPGSFDAAMLVLTGATGYGLSLRLYLLAQRKVGAGRTGSVFAIAPFLGVLLSAPLGEAALSTSSLLGGALFAVAVYLHLSERHAHYHSHDPLVHEHAHRHDDLHHDHVHDREVPGAHSHVHAHAAQTHEHEHAPDVHHEHRH